MNRDDHPRIVAHSGELAALQIRRQATVARPGIAAMQRLPRKIIGVIGMTIDQAQQPLMEHIIERRVRAQDRSLLRRYSKAEQQGWRSRQKPRQRRMEQAVQTFERL